jgi:tRNA uridine 5-carbamoylmethylation protein Kti12
MIEFIVGNMKKEWGVTMKRIVILTVGKTHSGKTTFAKALEHQLENSLVIDQDNQAEFINTHYNNLLPKKGPNIIKYAISNTIVDYSVNQTNLHLILCNSNRNQKGRLDLLTYFKNKGFTSILVNFHIPDEVLQERVANSERSTAIFRSATSFEEVLVRQREESGNIKAPSENEADYFFVIENVDDNEVVIQKIIDIARGI